MKFAIFFGILSALCLAILERLSPGELRSALVVHHRYILSLLSIMFGLVSVCCMCAALES